MNVVHVPERTHSSIFLAGPTPRSEAVPSWRPRAIELLHVHMFDGTVYVPEARDWKQRASYDDQVEWEWAALNVATVILFWVPRELTTMPAFTTNVEFGLYVRSMKPVVYGRPPDAPKCGYLDALAESSGLLIYESLERATLQAVALAS